MPLCYLQGVFSSYTHTHKYKCGIFFFFSGLYRTFNDTYWFKQTIRWFFWNKRRKRTHTHTPTVFSWTEWRISHIDSNEKCPPKYIILYNTLFVCFSLSLFSYKLKQQIVYTRTRAYAFHTKIQVMKKKVNVFGTPCTEWLRATKNPFENMLFFIRNYKKITVSIGILRWDFLLLSVYY